jgi:hypothetical protein
MIWKMWKASEWRILRVDAACGCFDCGSRKARQDIKRRWRYAQLRAQQNEWKGVERFEMRLLWTHNRYAQ